MIPPSAPRIPSVRELHGRSDADDYAWMRDPDEPSLRAYLEAERAYYDDQAARLGDLTDRLFIESTGRIPKGDEASVHWPRSGYLYRTVTPEGRENLQFLRSRPGESSEQLLLDENIIGTDYVDVGDRLPSPDGTLLAWSADTTGAEVYQLRVRNLRCARLDTGADTPDPVDPDPVDPDPVDADLIERTYPGLAWSADSRYLFYLVPDELNRAFQVWRHELARPAAADVLVLTEPDARYEITLHGSRSGDYAVITSESRDTTEVRLVYLADPAFDLVLVRGRQPGVEYRVDHARSSATGPGELLIVTDEECQEFDLRRARPGEDRWSLVDCAAVAPARADTRLHRCDVIGDRLLLTLRRGGAPLLASTGRDGGDVIEVPPSLPAGTIRVEHAEDYDAGSVIIAEESLISPPAWYRLDLATGERTLLKRREVPGYDPGEYRTERVTATARDGTAIPVTLAYHARTPLDGTAPCLLHGYGAYEDSNDPAFELGLPSLLDRGVVYAIAHVRGGGEGGRNWWQQGRRRSKPTTFTDFIDVADWLAGAGGVVDGERIVAWGLSAGGLLMGAVYSMRPDRWAAVVAQVPFVDCVNTMLDPSIPLTITEWDEWGDPRDLGDFEVMRSYSPYDNPPSGDRPPLLVTGAVHDPRVAVHEPAKWVARLRATAPGGSPEVVFRVELGAGAHTGPSGRFAQARYEAQVNAFVLDAMGISQ
ncbi:MAG TPA: prolyl oligopeptidase family serine peptidase [Streptosporangiaceae bacterium]|nr:prolyl oligopeptidase family serine peptidase [Streptosporangiaceae bacterium]